MLNLRVSGLKNTQTKQNKTLMLQRKKNSDSEGF